MRKLLFITVLFITCNISIAQDQLADLGYFPRTEFNEKVVSSDTTKTSIVTKKIVIDGFDSRVPFYYIQPKNNPENRFVILIHGQGDSKLGWMHPTGDLSKKYIRIRDSLLTLGYAVIIPDMKYHGERTSEIDYAPTMSLYHPKNAQKLCAMFTSSVKDIRLIMDYMESRSTDSPINFHVIGYSMGGMITILLNSVETRLKSVVACVVALDLATMSKWFGWEGTAAGVRLDGVFDLYQYAKIQKSPICMLMGNSDTYYTEEKARDYFEQITIKEKSLKIYESGHYLPETFIADAIKFIK
jgi:dienelactone hydrolase